MNEKPLIMERPQRGREMVSKQVPGGLVGTEQGTTLMHEGYVGDTKYMVPDMSLQLMKELVDLQLGKQQQYGRGTQSKSEKLEQKYTGKMERMTSKLDGGLLTPDSSSFYSTDTDDRSKRKSSGSKKSSKYSTTETDDEETSTTELSSSKIGKQSGQSPRNTPRTSKSTAGSGRTSNMSGKSSGKGSQRRDSQGSSGTPKSFLSDLSKRSRGSASGKSSGTQEEYDFDPKYAAAGSFRGGTEPFIDGTGFRTEKIRFLISGHVKMDRSAKPIFIFNQYDGSSPFGDENPDFSTSKTTGDLTLGIRGKFYKESILEEMDGVPKSLKIQPDKIPIDSNCKLWEEEFSENIQIGDYDITIDGKFLKQNQSEKFTPFFAFKIQSIRSSEMDLTPKSENVISNISPIPVFIAKSGLRSPFRKRPTKEKKSLNNVSLQNDEDHGHQSSNPKYRIITVDSTTESNIASKNRVSKKLSNFDFFGPEGAGKFKQPFVVYSCTFPRQRKQKSNDKKETDGVLKRISKLIFPDSET